MYSRYIRFVIRHPVFMSLTILAITAVMATQIPRIRIDPELDSFIPAENDAQKNLDELEEIFGNSYLTRILVVRDDHPDGIYNPETLALLARITEWAAARPEFETLRSSDLRSLTTVNNILGSDDGMVVRPFMEAPPTDRDGAVRLREELENNGMYIGVLVAEDGSAASIMVRESEVGREDRAAVYRLIADYVESLRAEGRPEQFHISGRTIVEGLFGRYISEEGERMMPFVAILIAIFLLFSFRTARGVLIPFAVLGCTEVWMLGSIGALQWRYYSVTSILPVLIMAIAIADAIHLLARYYEEQSNRPDADREQVIHATMLDMGPPVLMTSVTTIAGFMSMTTSPVLPLQQFGIVMSIGILSALLTTLVFMPALLSMLPLDGARAQRRRETPENDWFARRILPATAYCNTHPLRILGGIVVLVVVGLTGVSRLTTDTSQVKQFRPGHHLREADRVDNERFSGATILDIMVDGQTTDAMKDPVLLSRIEALQMRLEEMELVGDTFSIAELIRRMNRVMNEDRSEADVLPSERELIAQYLLLYSISGDPGDFDDLVDYDYRYAHVFVFVKDPGTRASAEVVREARSAARELFPAGDGPTATVKLAGTSYSSTVLEGFVIDSQISTLWACMPSIFLLSLFLFRNAWMALLAVTPVALSILSTYGGMGFISLPTDIATTMLGAMALGIGVDFAIHYIYRYRQVYAHERRCDIAAERTALTAGRALFYNAAVLIAGFLTLLAARFYPQVKLGVLVSVTMVICYMVTMLLFPAGLRLIYERRR